MPQPIPAGPDPYGRERSARAWQEFKTLTIEEARAALGSIGFNAVSDESEFIRTLLRNQQYDFVNQTLWLFDHSGMKIPSAEVFEKSYQEGIMQPLLLNSGFGDYEPI